MSGSQDYIVASDGERIAVDSLDQSFNYNADGSLNYIQVTHSGANYRQTYTYTSGKLTGISKWVKQ